MMSQLCKDRTEAPGAPYGADGDRTRNLSIANAALSQLSYGPGRSEWEKVVGRSDWRSDGSCGFP
jgi:hypothetical protein